MNRLHLSSALKDEPAGSPPKVVFWKAELSTPTTPGSAESTETWLLIVAGLLSANLMASLLCRLPESHTLPWAKTFFLSIGYVALTLAAGAAGVAIPWFLLKAKPSFGLLFLYQNLAVSWLFLPCITLLCRQRSPWMFPVVALATVAGAFSLRRLFPAAVETEPAQSLAAQTSGLPTLYGLPITGFQPLRVFFIALCIQGALCFAVGGSFFLAGLLLSASLSLLVWRWIALDIQSIKNFTGRRPPVLLCVFAIFLTLLAMLPWVAAVLHGALGRNAIAHQQSPGPHLPIEPDKPTSEYVGIILWPPPAKKTAIVPPKPHLQSLTVGGKPKPVVIPFDGPYWYFKAPSSRPGPHAHIAHGRATDVTIRSSDWSPLLMEAHQNLGSSIDLKCCSEIDVTIINADTRSGKIALGLLLTDSSTPGKPSHSLGERTIVSSEAAQIPLNRQPVNELLRFTISRSTAMSRFDEITIVFLPAKERARGGAKVSIQSFTLIRR